MSVKVAINGFGRIGRLAFRQRKDMGICCKNDGNHQRSDER